MKLELSIHKWRHAFKEPQAAAENLGKKGAIHKWRKGKGKGNTMLQKNIGSAGRLPCTLKRGRWAEESLYDIG